MVRLGQDVFVPGFPDHFAGLGVQRHHMAVHLGDIDLAIGDRHAARLRAAAQAGEFQDRRVGPQFLAGHRVIGLDHIARGFDEQDAVDLDRRGFHGVGDAGLDQRHGLELLDIGGVDFGQRRKALIVIGSAMQPPIVLVGIGIEPLRIGIGDIGRDRLHLKGDGVWFAAGCWATVAFSSCPNARPAQVTPTPAHKAVQVAPDSTERDKAITKETTLAWTRKFSPVRLPNRDNFLIDVRKRNSTKLRDRLPRS